MLPKLCTGLLSPPTNIQLKFLWKNQFLNVTICWDQPFTLNLTSSSSDNSIITYRVFVNVRHNISNSTLEVYNTSTTRFVYNYSTINLNLGGNVNCNELLLPSFQVSAINRVGIGERSDPVNLYSIFCITGIKVQSTDPWDCTFVH